jgi:hypothetical protein
LSKVCVHTASRCAHARASPLKLGCAVSTLCNAAETSARCVSRSTLKCGARPASRAIPQRASASSLGLPILATTRGINDCTTNNAQQINHNHAVHAVSSAHGLTSGCCAASPTRAIAGSGNEPTLISVSGDAWAGWHSWSTTASHSSCKRTASVHMLRAAVKLACLPRSALSS